MIVGALRLTFAVPHGGNSSHAIASRIKDKIWTRFKISVAEMPEVSQHEVIIGVTTVGFNEKNVRERLEKIVDVLKNSGDIELVNDEMEMIHFDDLELERDFEKYNP